MKCGIVVLNYNNYKETLNFIDSIEHQKLTNLDLRVCIVDNNSQNDSYMIIKKYLKKMKNKRIFNLIQSGRNRGYSDGNNIGIECLKSEGITKICICNNDISFKNDFIQSGFFILQKKNSAIIAPQIIQENHYIPPLYKRRPNLFSFLWRGPLLPFKRIADLNYKPHKKNIYAMSGACFFVDMRAFEATDLFDANVFLYGEELILGEKAYKKKANILLVPDLFVYHEDSSTTKMSIELHKRFCIMYKSLQYYLTKYRSDISRNELPIILFLLRFEEFYAKIKNFIKIK